MSPRRRTILRRLARVVFGIVATLTALVLIAFALLHTDWGRDKVRGVLEEQLTKKIRGKVTIGRLEGDVLDAVTLRDVVIEERDGHPAVRIDRLYLDYRLMPLLGGHFHADEVAIDGLAVVARRGADGRLTLADLWIREPEEEVEVFTATFEDIEIDRSSVVLESEPGRFEHFTGVALRASVMIGVDDTAIDVGGLQARWQEKERDLAAAAHFVLTKESVDVTDGDVVFGTSRVQVPTLRWHSADGLAALATASITAGDLRALWPSSRLRGDALVNLFVNQRSGEPWRVAAFGGVGTASLALVGQVTPPAEDGDPLQATASLSWAGAQPHALWVGAPRGDVSGWAEVDWSGRDLDGGRASARLGVSGSMSGVAFSRLDATADLAARHVTARASADSPHGSASASVQAQLPEEGGARAIDVQAAEVRAHAHDVASVEKALGRPPTVRGPITVRASAHGRLDRLSVRGRATSAGMVGDGIGLAAIDVTFSLDDLGRRPVGRITARVHDITRGGTSLGGARVNAVVSDSGRTATADFALGGAGGIAASGALRARGATPGSRIGPGGVHVDVERLRIAMRDLVWQAAEGSAITIEPGARAVTGSLELTSQAGRVRVAAGLRRSAGSIAGPIDLDVDLDLARVLVAMGKLDARQQARVKGSVVARGQVMLPAGPVSLDIDAKGLAWDGTIKRATAKLAARLSRRQLAVHFETELSDVGRASADLAARAPARPLDLAAWRRGGMRAVESLRAEVQGVDLGRVGQLIEQPRLGGGTASVVVTGGRGLETIRVSAKVDGVELRGAKHVGSLRGDVQATIDLGRDLRVELHADTGKRGAIDLILVADRPQRLRDIAAWKRTGARALRSGELHARKIDLRQFEPLLMPLDDDQARMTPRVNLDGSIDVDLTATRQAKVIDGVIALHKVRTRRLATPLSGTVTAALRPTRSDVTVDLHIDGRPLVNGVTRVSAGTTSLLGAAASGPLPARLRAATLHGNLVVPDQALRPLVQMVDPSSQIDGKVGGSIALRGTVGDPVVTAELKIPGLTVEGVRFDTFELDGRYSRAGWSAQALARQADGGSLDLKARADAGDAGALRVKLRTHDFKLRFLAPLWRRPGGGLTHLDGLVDANLVIAGTIARPIIDGSLKVREGEARLPDFLRPLQHLSVRLTFKHSKADLLLTARSHPGRVEVKATANLARPEAASFEVRVRGKNLPVLAGTQLISVSGNVRAQGALRNRLWRIDTVIERGLLVRLPNGRAAKLHDTKRLDDVRYVDPAGLAAREAAEEVTEAAGIGARITLKTEQPMMVRGDEIATDVRVKLVITMVRGTTSITGRVEAKRGYVEIIGRRYTVERARVIFAGEMPVNPRIDVRVGHRFNRQTVFIDVVGRASRPNVTFASDSGTQDQGALLSLVLSGDQPGSGQQQGVGQRSANAALNLLAGQFAQSLKRSGLPIDSVAVGTEAGAEQKKTYVTVGKWLTSRLFVAYRRRFEAEIDENNNEGVFQHFFARDWMWEGVAGDRGTASADVLWVVPF